MLKKHNVRDIRIPRSTVGLLSTNYNENVVVVFYVKYTVNAFQKNSIQDAKNKKENVEIVKNYPLGILQIVINSFIFL